jgi:Mg2+ and Co2+ transporter CorA
VNFSFPRGNEDGLKSESKSDSKGDSKGESKDDNEGTRPPPLESFEVDFKNVQDMQRLEELIRSIKTALEINEDCIKSLQSLNNKLYKLQTLSLGSWHEVDNEAEQHLARISLHKRNFETLLGNVHGRAQLLYNVLDFRNALTVAYSTQRAVDINHLQANETAMMGMLNEMSLRDNIGVKILTLLATLYVPASFVAVSLPWIQGL